MAWIAFEQRWVVFTLRKPALAPRAERFPLSRPFPAATMYVRLVAFLAVLKRCGFEGSFEYRTHDLHILARHEDDAVRLTWGFGE